MNSINSAEAYFSAVANQAEKEIRENREKEENKKNQQEIILQLKEQVSLLKKQNEQTTKELKRTRIYNFIYLGIAVLSAVFAILTFIFK